MRRVIFIVALMLLFVSPAFAQWEGNIKADGAWNFKQSNRENTDFNLKYTGQKFYFGTNVNFGHSFQPSSQVTSILDKQQKTGVVWLKAGLQDERQGDQGRDMGSLQL